MNDCTYNIHIACAANAAYVPHVATLLQSVAANHGHNVTVHFLHDASVSGEQLAQLHKQVRQSDMRLVCYQPTPDRLAGLPVTERYPQVVWFRILLPELLPDVERVLYLDADTLVLQSLSALWDLPMQDFLLGAVQDVISPNHALPRKIGLARTTDYFNSGVLLLNLRQMRSEDFLSKITKQDYSDYPAGYPDQVALNWAMQGRWLRLHPKWNCMTPLIPNSLRAQELTQPDREQQLAAISPCILHFEGLWNNEKPWHYRCVHPYQWLYIYYRNLTAWPLSGLDGRTFMNRIIKLLPRWPLYAFHRLKAFVKHKASTVRSIHIESLLRNKRAP